MKMKKETRIRREVKRLCAFYADLPEDRQTIARTLIEQAAFMRATLEDLQDEINLKGVSDEYTNGEHQRGVKATAEFKAYNTLVKSYTSVMKQLDKMLPKKAASNRLLDFINK